MAGSPTLKSVRSEQNPTATLGLEDLELGERTAKVEDSQSAQGSKKACNDVPSTRQPVHPSDPDSHPPDYRPLNIRPLGSTHDASPPLNSKPMAARYELPNRIFLSNHQKPSVVTQRNPYSSLPASRGAFTQKANQHPFSGQRTSPPSADTAPGQPFGRWFGSAPIRVPRPAAQKTRSSSPTKEIRPPPIPVPNAAYSAQSAIVPTRLRSPQPLLLVLDLNGTLLYRPRASSAYQPRPSMRLFLAHCISNYRVLIWSSATPTNVTAICSKIFTQEQRSLLLGEWARDTLDLTPQQYQSKVQVYKRLDRIWGLERMQRAHPVYADGGRWSQKNTLLLDDSVLKASAQPYNAVIVPEFVKGGGDEQKAGTDVLGQVVTYLERARTYDDVSSFVRTQPFRANEGSAGDSNLKSDRIMDSKAECNMETGIVGL
ncbi:MAG: hypothetical protein Q9219_001755 [cf. Caloplaca sp. 3 TL-2023]